MSFSLLRRTFTSVTQRPNLTIALLPADGIGKEVIPSARRVLESLPSSIDSRPTPTFSFVELDAGWECFQRKGKALPSETIEAIRDNNIKGGLFGAVSSPSNRVEGYSSPIVALRKELDLFANVRPVKSVGNEDGKDIDMVIVRENTECLYVKSETIESDPSTGLKTAWARRKISEYASRRIGEMAFRLAVERGTSREAQRKAGESVFWKGPPKVTIVHKSNVLSVTDGLFRETVRSIKENDPNGTYKGVQMEEQLVDSMVYRMFREPQVFDVAVAPNLYGDIISDGAAALVGSLGLVPSANVGPTFILGEPVHGSAPDIAGKDIANPLAAIRSAAMLLDYLGYSAHARHIENVVTNLLMDAKNNSSLVTPDLGGSSSCTKVTEEVIKRL